MISKSNYMLSHYRKPKKLRLLIDVSKKSKEILNFWIIDDKTDKVLHERDVGGLTHSRLLSKSYSLALSRM